MRETRRARAVSASRLAGTALAVVAVAVSGVLAACAGAAPTATVIEAEGDTATHDPALVITDDAWYVFSTGDLSIGGGAPQIRRSTDEGVTWERIGTVWDAATRPEWAYAAVPGVTNFWAPEVVEHDGTYYLYYSASTFGKNTSAIGLTTSASLDPNDPDYGWTDQGVVWQSAPGVNYNAIDPGVITAQDGTPWMAFGSFWGGIQLVELAWPDGKPVADAEPTLLAARGFSPNPIEAPYLVWHDDWYYLFVSRDFCCRGTDSTYNIAVGRARDVTGPYLGPDDAPMTSGGGLSLLSTDGDMVGPGGQSVSDGVLAFHYYDAAAAGAFRLGLRELAWTEDGWPVARTAQERRAFEDASASS